VNLLRLYRRVLYWVAGPSSPRSAGSGSFDYQAVPSDWVWAICSRHRPGARRSAGDWPRASAYRTVSFAYSLSPGAVCLERGTRRSIHSWITHTKGSRRRFTHDARGPGEIEAAHATEARIEEKVEVRWRPPVIGRGDGRANTPAERMVARYAAGTLVQAGPGIPVELRSASVGWSVVDPIKRSLHRARSLAVPVGIGVALLAWFFIRLARTSFACVCDYLDLSPAAVGAMLLACVAGPSRRASQSRPIHTVNELPIVYRAPHCAPTCPRSCRQIHVNDRMQIDLKASALAPWQWPYRPRDRCKSIRWPSTVRRVSR